MPSKNLSVSARFHLTLVLCLFTAATGFSLRASTMDFVNFEAHQTRPVCLSPDGKKLFVVNTADARLSIFDVSNSKNPAPVLLNEIPVGLEPVSVNAVSNDEVWVINEVSDSVSVVSVSTGAVTATLACKDEPADVVFAGNLAFVSCSRNNLISVFNRSTLALITTIPLTGLNPRSLAVSGDATKIYAAFALAGNRTTVLSAALAPTPPPPTNPDLPPPPQVSLIVSADDVRLNPKPILPSYGVAEIDVATKTVSRYFAGVGTVNFFAATRPGAKELWVANTDARNLIQFEPNLKGHAVDNRVTRINTTSRATVTPFDLNPGIDYTLSPNPVAQTTALAQPTGLVFEPDGAYFWVAAFGSDRVARVNASTGLVTTRIETGPTTGAAADSALKRGPRSLVYQASTGRLYIANRIANTITVISTQAKSALTEIPVGSYDPTPDSIRNGRGFLYDARLSGNGTQSCASCHVDGDRDGLAWDLGDPDGLMTYVKQYSPVLNATNTFAMHPMKGPMVTQSLRGIVGTNPLHWRGDHANFQAFNPAFATLLGGSELSDPDMSAFNDFVDTINYEPNPNENLDRTLPATFPPGSLHPGDPVAGQNTFLNEPYKENLTCNTCHTLPTGTSGLISPSAVRNESQPFKAQQLRDVYQKIYYNPDGTDTALSGFGVTHDGSVPSVYALLSQPFFGTFASDITRKTNLSAFLSCLDSGSAPCTGYSRTVNSANLASAGADWTLLESQAVLGNIDLQAQALFKGTRHGLLYQPGTDNYLTDTTGKGPYNRAQLEASITAGQLTLTLMGVPPGSGYRCAIDSNRDGILDGDQTLPP